MNYWRFLISLMLLFGIGLSTAIVNAAVEKVNCDKGGSLQAALDRHIGNSMPIDIYLSGTCRENVSVKGGPLWIFGQDNAVIDGTLSVGAGITVIINDTTITGPGAGIRVERGNVYLHRTSVTGNEGMGISLDRGSFVQMSDSTISLNNRSGIWAGLGSTVMAFRTQISSNWENGIATDNNASVSVAESTISDNGHNGIHAYFHSSATVENSEISSNGHAGILISKDAGVMTRSNVTISGNGSAGVYCEDNESSFENSAPISDAILCTGFN